MPEEIPEIPLLFEAFLLGLGAAFLLVAASYFTEVGVRIRDRSVGQKLVFVLAGGVCAALVCWANESLPRHSYLVAGAGWQYIAVSLSKGAKAFDIGREALKKHGGAALRAAAESVMADQDPQGGA